MKRAGELLCSQNAHGETVLVRCAQGHLPSPLYMKAFVVKKHTR
jgi:hypothetical protein